MDAVQGKKSGTGPLVLESALFSVSKHFIGVYIVLIIDSKHFNALV